MNYLSAQSDQWALVARAHCETPEKCDVIVDRLPVVGWRVVEDNARPYAMPILPDPACDEHARVGLELYDGLIYDYYGEETFGSRRAWVESVREDAISKAKYHQRARAEERRLLLAAIEREEKGEG